MEEEDCSELLLTQSVYICSAGSVARLSRAVHYRRCLGYSEDVVRYWTVPVPKFILVDDITCVEYNERRRH